MIKAFIMSCIVALAMVGSSHAATFEFMRVPSISSMSYRPTGGGTWTPATINGLHGQFSSSPSLMDVEINGTWSSHDFTGMTSGAFVTVVGEQPTQWAFNYDNYIGDEVTLWLPLQSSVGIPEPSSVALVLCSIAGLAMLRRYAS